MLNNVKKEMVVMVWSIEYAVTEKNNVYTSLKAKILEFCVTRWTVRAGPLNNIMKNYEALQTLFARILTDKVEKNGFDEEKRTEISGLVKNLQRFEFFFGLRLSITVYTIVDSHAIYLQGTDVNISSAMEILRNIVKELTVQKNDYEDFWKESLKER